MFLPDARFFLTGEPLDPAAAAQAAGADLVREGRRLVCRAASLNEVDLSDAVVFADSEKTLARLEGREVALCFAKPESAGKTPFRGALAAHPDPKRAFAQIAAWLHKERPYRLSAGIDPSAQIGHGAQIHETAVIAQDASIGARTLIGPHVFIGPGVEIGEDGRVGPNASVICALIGARVLILAGARIGEEGFGFARGAQGFVRVPQLGRVIIGDDVEVGANSTIDRGALGDTVIEDGVKIDNLVQVGHNVRVGKGAALAAQVGVAGSTVIGAGVLIAGQAGLADHLTIGDGARIAAQAGLMRDVPKGEHWGGTPARPATAWFRETAALTKLAARKKTKKDGND
ncbi:MAG: UDP-3-O-(3-hydroxymyristoyl)glucosamine N-acyltransferase [Alphaproteobacteria bacterium]|nr:UDP-3-O-(3-hydroxymyristoyl)glucosamine N-acyltransferase [Alphaproteobacteria bacterium]